MLKFFAEKMWVAFAVWPLFDFFLSHSKDAFASPYRSMGIFSQNVLGTYGWNLQNVIKVEKKKKNILFP